MVCPTLDRASKKPIPPSLLKLLTAFHKLERERASTPMKCPTLCLARKVAPILRSYHNTAIFKSSTGRNQSSNSNDVSNGLFHTRARSIELHLRNRGQEESNVRAAMMYHTLGRACKEPSTLFSATYSYAVIEIAMICPTRGRARKKQSSNSHDMSGDVSHVRGTPIALSYTNQHLFN